MRQAVRMKLSSLAAVLAAGAPPAAAPAVGDAPPRERDCLRWVEALRPLRATESASAASAPPGAAPSAYADRAPNADPALLASLRRPVSLELLHCEQLNLKDKLDWLIRRLL
jgi:hypothetical protein